MWRLPHSLRSAHWPSDTSLITLVVCDIMPAVHSNTLKDQTLFRFQLSFTQSNQNVFFYSIIVGQKQNKNYYSTAVWTKVLIMTVVKSNYKGQGVCCFFFFYFLDIPEMCKEYLRDESTLTIQPHWHRNYRWNTLSHLVTLYWQEPGQPVLALTLPYQAPGRVATVLAILKSLV